LKQLAVFANLYFLDVLHVIKFNHISLYHSVLFNQCHFVFE